MQRKKLSRISCPTNEHGSRESKLFATMATKGDKRKRMFGIKPKPCISQNQCHTQAGRINARRINPFKIQLTEKKLLTNYRAATEYKNKRNKNSKSNTVLQNKVNTITTYKKQGTLDYFWNNNNGDENL
jgi:hypothetical protein